MLTDGLEWCGLLVMFLSAVWTLILMAPIHCRASDGMTFLQIWWRNKLIYISDGLRMSTFTAHFYFWVNYSFKLWLKRYRFKRGMHQFFTCYIAQKSSLCVRHPGSPVWFPPLERRSIISPVMRSASGSLSIHLVLSSGQQWDNYFITYLKYISWSVSLVWMFKFFLVFNFMFRVTVSQSVWLFLKSETLWHFHNNDLFVRVARIKCQLLSQPITSLGRGYLTDWPMANMDGHMEGMFEQAEEQIMAHVTINPLYIGSWLIFIIMIHFLNYYIGFGSVSLPWVQPSDGWPCWQGGARDWCRHRSRFHRGQSVG